MGSIGDVTVILLFSINCNYYLILKSRPRITRIGRIIRCSLFGFKFQDSGFKRLGFKIQGSGAAGFKIQVSGFRCFMPVIGLPLREVMNLLIALLRLRLSLYNFLAVSLSMKPTSVALMIWLRTSPHEPFAIYRKLMNSLLPSRS